MNGTFGSFSPTFNSLAFERPMHMHASIRPDGRPGETMAKNFYDRQFQTMGKKRYGYTNGELYFGSPGRTLDTRLTSGFQTKNPWADAFLEVNLIQTSKVINMIERVMDAFEHVEVIAPLVFTNSMQVKVQTKTYTDDAAEFIALEGPVSNVGMAIAERTEQLKFIGKGAEFQMNIMTSPQGREELNEKLMLIAFAIKKTEYLDFLKTVRNRNFPEVEIKRMENANGDADQYLDQIKSDFDCFRKYENGTQNLLERISTTIGQYHGKINHCLVPEEMYVTWIFKPENWVHYIKGEKSEGFYDKVDRDVFGDGPIDKTKIVKHKLKGLTLHMIPRIATSVTDTYMDICARNTMIGNFFGLFMKRDPGFDAPEDFQQKDLTVRTYSQQHDSFKLIGYLDCVNASARFDENGKPRHVRPSYRGYHNQFKKFDPLYCDVRGTIRLFGEMMPSKYHAKDFYKGLNYSAATFLNHLNGKIDDDKMGQFERMFEILENATPGDTERDEWWDVFTGLNFKVAGRNPNVMNYLDMSTNNKYVLEPEYDGYYTLPPGVVPMGCASYIGLVSVSKMVPVIPADTEDQKNLNFIIKTSKEFLRVFGSFYNIVTRALPESCLTKEGLCKSYAPVVFQNMRDDQVGKNNMFNNGIRNATNFIQIMFETKVSQKMLSHITENKSPREFFPKPDTEEAGVEEFYTKLTEESKKRTAPVLDDDFFQKLESFGYIEGGKVADLQRFRAVDDVSDLNDPNGPLLSSLTEGFLGDEYTALNVTFDSIKKDLVSAPDKYKAYMKRVIDQKNKFWIWINAKLLGKSIRSSGSQPIQTGLSFTKSLREFMRKNPADRISETIYEIDPRTKMVVETDGNINTRSSIHDDRLGEFSKPRKSTEENVMGGHVMSVFTYLDNEIRKTEQEEPNHSLFDKNSISYTAFKEKDGVARSSPMRTLVWARKHGIRNMFHECALVMLLLADFHADNLKGMFNTKVCPPIEYINARPYGRYTTYPFIGLGTGSFRRYRGHMLTMSSLNATTGGVQLRYTQSTGCVPVEPKNAVVHEDVFVLASQGGCGTTFFDYNEYVNKTKDYFDPDQLIFGNEGDNASVFAIEVPIGSLSSLHSSNLDVTGTFQCLKDIEDSKFSGRGTGKVPLYSTAYSTNSFWNFSGSEVYGDFGPPNTWVSQEACYYADLDGKYTDKITSQTHFGEEGTYEGAARYRKGMVGQPTARRRVF